MRVVICGGGVVGACTWPLLRLVHRFGARPTSQKVSRDRHGRQCFTDAWRPKSKGGCSDRGLAREACWSASRRGRSTSNKKRVHPASERWEYRVLWRPPCKP